MVRAPCCEKMGLKKGPWTPEEDKILIAYIQKHGHGNWRALPRHAGLLRCGKSCRLRWTNYLRPDIKRGNFTKEEEDVIVSLHQMLGNRWSAIAASLPGRTDNEIKNVWHTHLKKRLSNDLESAFKSQRGTSKSTNLNMEFNKATTASPAQSWSDLSCCGNESLKESGDNSNASGKEGLVESWDEGFQQIDDSFWMEALSVEGEGPLSTSADDSFFMSAGSSADEDNTNFWLRIFLQAGDSQGLPEI